MFTTYSDANKVELSLLKIWYEQELELVGTGDQAQYFIKVTRRATRGVKWVNMTPEAADACVEALRAKYTRRFLDRRVEGSSISATDRIECTASIDATANESGSCDATLQVDEEDIGYISQSMAGGSWASAYVLRQYFSEAQSRDYD